MKHQLDPLEITSLSDIKLTLDNGRGFDHEIVYSNRDNPRVLATVSSFCDPQALILARLFVAAPQLLAVLNQCLHALENVERYIHDDHSTSWVDDIAAAIPAAHAAIARALNGEPTQNQPPAWAIVEIFGHKKICGQVSASSQFGDAMLRIDVPATTSYPAFTRLYGVAAIYSITYVEEEVARASAESLNETPINIYAPGLITLDDHRKVVEQLRREIVHLRGLPAAGDDNDDNEENDWEEEESDL